MSEQLSIGNKVIIGPYEWYSDVGASTLGQLKKSKIIPNKQYEGYELRKPDAILVDRRNTKEPHVVVVCEYKSVSAFKTEAQRLDAIQQCNDLLQELDADMGMITDNQTRWIWINGREENKDNEYIDKNGKNRSYTIIRNEEKLELADEFVIDQQKDEKDLDKIEFATKETLDLIERVRKHINKANSILIASEEVDPTGLAESVWQDIFVATGQEPEKCLYNVVELFVFKFLSDLSVLKAPFDFKTVLELARDNQVEGLEYYANNVREKIRGMFPPSNDDETTIINGTIFVYNGKAVSQNAGLFLKSLKKYDDFGDFTTIQKSFKTNLYEKFLKRDSGVKGLGQYFTPRKVITPIVEMAQVERLQSGAKICDPFCGTGGFLMEALSRKEVQKTFEPNSKGIIEPKVFLRGYDKGSDEKDSERTIILAKANMLIYLSNIIKRHPNLTKEFSQIFNNTFKLKKDSILGTLNEIPKSEEDKYDLILTNPPYVTTGCRILKEEIKKDTRLNNFYAINGMGVEGLSMEWIVRNLRPGGRAFVVIPDGILNRLNDKNLRQFILNECFLNGIISLPINTFFTTPKKTYVLILTKKHNKEYIQKKPVFSYLVTDIGETLDIYRFDTGKSDLEEAKEKFLMFQGSEKMFKKINNDARCKIWNISKFNEMIDQNRTIDRWRTEEEKIALGIEEEKQILSIEEFLDKVVESNNKIKEMEDSLKILLNNE